MLKYLRLIDWLALSTSALVLVVVLWVMTSLFPQEYPPTKPEPASSEQQQPAQGNNESASLFDSLGAWVERNKAVIEPASILVTAIFTIILAGSTAFLFCATRRLVLGAENASRRELRAYVGFRAQYLPNGIAPDRDIAVGLIAVNDGRTPAVGVEGAIGADIRHCPLINLAFPSPPQKQEKWDMITNAIWTLDTKLHIDVSNYTEMLADRKTIFVWEFITYKDIFGWSVRLDFRYRLHQKLAGDGWELRAEPNGYETTYKPPEKNAGLSETG